MGALLTPSPGCCSLVVSWARLLVSFLIGEIEMTLYQEIAQLQAGMEQGIYSEEDYAKALLEIILRHGVLNLYNQE